ncbi:MAG: ABC transporter substrate-binding protein [Sulfurospirillaceae bacterium]|nr:ABC transporter substrate-binding protein [Sulfurospirillaceae bacterium]
MSFVKKISTLIALISFLLIATSSTVSADELATLQKSGVMKIAMSGAYPPFNFVNEQNKVVGFDPAIGREIAKRLGMKVEIITTAWDGIIAGLLANKYDAIVGSMSITDKRKKVVDFVGPYYRMHSAVFVKKGSNISSLKDLKGHTVGVVLGETHEKWARTHASWDIKTYKGLPELLMELDTGRIDAFVSDDIPVLVAIKKNGVKVTELNVPSLSGTSDSAGIAIRKGNDKLREAMQKALEGMQKDGTYTKIAKKWIGADIR